MAFVLPSLLSFGQGALGQTIGTLNLLGVELGASEEQLKKLNAAAGAAQGVFSLLNQIFGVFVQSNEALNQQLLASQGLLANNVNVFDLYGNKVTDLREKLESTRGLLKDTIKELEKDTQQLVGVTTEDVNAAFNIVLRNIGDIQGQSKKSTLDAAKDITADIVAAAGALGLGRDQIAQEARALLSGDVNNPDALLSQSLGLDKGVVAQKKAQGEYIDFLQEKLASFREANALAADSLTGVSSNITDFFQRITRVAGEDALKPITDALNEFYTILQNNEGDIQSGLTTAFKTAFDLVVSLAQVLKTQLTPLIPIVTTAFKGVAGITVVSLRFITGAFTALNNYLNFTRGIIVEVGKFIGKIFEPLGSTLLNTFNKAIQPLLENPLIQAALNGTKLAVDLVINPQNSDAVVQGYDEIRDSIGALADASEGLADKASEALSVDPKNKAALNSLVDGYKGIEDAYNQVEKSRAFGDRENLDRSQKLNQLAAEKAKLEAQYQKLTGRNIGDDFSVDFKDLNKEANALDETLKELNASRQAFNTVNERGTGNENTFDTATQAYVDQIKKAKELGLITREQAIADLDAVSKSEVAKREIRIAAFEEAQKLRSEESEKLNSVLEVEKAVNDALVARGKISSEQGAVNAQVAELKKLEDQARLTQESLNFKQANGLDFSKEKGELDKLNAEIDSANAKLGSLRFSQSLADVDLKVKKAQQNLEASTASSQLKLQELVNKGALSQSEAQVKLTEATIAQSQKRIENAKNELAQLEKLSPATLAEKQQLADRKASLRVQIINETKSALEQELNVRQQIIAQQQKLEELERNLSSARAKQPFEAELRARQQVTKELELQSSLQSSINRLIESQADLQVARAGIQVSLAQEVVGLQQKAASGSVEAANQLAELGASGVTNIDAANQLLAAQREQIQATLNATLTKLELERQSVELEQQKTNLAIEQEQIALRISQLETKASAAELKAKKASISADKNLSSKEKELQLEGIDQQLEVNSEISNEQAKQQQFLERKAKQQEKINKLEKASLANNQAATREQAIANAQSQERDARLANSEANGGNQSGQGASPGVFVGSGGGATVTIRDDGTIVKAFTEGFERVADRLEEAVTRSQQNIDRDAKPLQDLVKRIQELGGNVVEGKVILQGKSGLTDSREFGLQAEFDKLAAKVETTRALNRTTASLGSSKFATSVTQIQDLGASPTGAANLQPPTLAAQNSQQQTSELNTKTLEQIRDALTSGNNKPANTNVTNVTNNFPSNNGARAARRLQGE